ncbi:MFS transporter [Amnibacterium setariae]|uniref:MFS transporter n=1 Tax=Amnibacterium setariae TaxID=2306585 RepID=A0A3A1U1C8_9MICO|nr:MFS transporter [Amnibacterium setariae]RIX26427.1 MFS transporter [Amnibacterium setariae]
MSTTRTRPSAELRHWRDAVFTIFALCGFVFATWASRVPTVRDLLGASTQEMGFLILGMSAGSIVGVVAASHVVARLGATRTILWVYSAVAAGMILLGPIVAFVPAFLPIFLVLIVLGLASVVDVAMNLSGAANERAIGRTIMPLFHAAFSGGTVLGAAIGAFLEHLDVPIGVHFTAIGIVALVVNLVLVRFLQPAEQPLEEGAEPGPSGFRSRLAVWKDPRVILIGVIVLGMAFVEGSANDWLSLAMVDGHGFDNAGGAAVLSLFLAAMTAGRIGGVFVLDRFGRVPVLRASAALAVVGLLLVIVVPVDAIVIVGVVLWGVGASLGFPVGMSAAADDPRTATATVGAVATIGYTAFLVGPPLIGLIGEHTGILLALLVVLVLIAAAGLASGAARPIARPAAAPVPAEPTA